MTRLFSHTHGKLLVKPLWGKFARAASFQIGSCVPHRLGRQSPTLYLYSGEITFGKSLLGRMCASRLHPDRAVSHTGWEGRAQRYISTVVKLLPAKSRWGERAPRWRKGPCPEPPDAKCCARRLQRQFLASEPQVPQFGQEPAWKRNDYGVRLAVFQISVESLMPKFLCRPSGSGRPPPIKQLKTNIKQL